MLGSHREKMSKNKLDTVKFEAITNGLNLAPGLKGYQKTLLKCACHVIWSINSPTCSGHMITKELG